MRVFALAAVQEACLEALGSFSWSFPCRSPVWGGGDACGIHQLGQDRDWSLSRRLSWHVASGEFRLYWDGEAPTKRNCKGISTQSAWVVSRFSAWLWVGRPRKGSCTAVLLQSVRTAVGARSFIRPIWRRVLTAIQNQASIFVKRLVPRDGSTCSEPVTATA